MTTTQYKSDGIRNDLIVYLCLLALAGLQFVIAYQHIDAPQMLVRMLAVAVVEAGLAVMFFMHLLTEKRSFVLCVLILTIFVLVGMQFGWTDSSRMVTGAPFSK
ncbi:MAG TPA: cytochrome C oxidase subunit IV family protein [Terriglobales bacterium]|nr:cytochrome C oxidase subunit IV family protein [Terriglobales bacterium]